MKQKLWMLIMAAVLACGAIAVAAQESTQMQAMVGPEGEKHWHEIDADWLNKFHNPAPGITMGLDLRLRTIHGKNFIFLDDQFGDPAKNNNHWNFQTYRTRLWANFDLSPDVMFNTRLTWEFRTWRNSEINASVDTNLDDIFFDVFNITWKNAFDAPLTLVIGRQDIILGQGWLVLDGTPLDDARSIFFDAVRATYNSADTSTVYDFIYINQDAEQDHRIMPFNDQDAPVMEQDERGFIVQASNTSLENTQIDGYYIYKEDKKSVYNITGTRDAELHTIGARVNGNMDTNWAYYLEAADQWGKKNLATVQAYGLNSRLSYKFNDERNNSLRVGYELLSGDDPTSSEDESFDVLWGRWARWSELYVYSFASETRIAQVTNTHRVNLGHTFMPAPRWSVDTDYNLLWADDNTYKTNDPMNRFTDSGKFRGQLVTCWLKYSCCKNFNMHWMAEYFKPSDYYDRSNRDYALYLRFGVEYVF